MSKCLGNIEVHIWELFGPDMLKEPPEWHDICHIGGLCVTRTASKHATNMAIDVGDC
jgi:hypothetical protein